MCRSCAHKYNGKYCQQCAKCGHPAHDNYLCGVGVINMTPRIDGTEESVGCLCPQERYER